MSSILTCPSCQGGIALPEGVIARLQCPHCGVELSFQADTPPIQAPPPVLPARPLPAAAPRPRAAPAPAPRPAPPPRKPAAAPPPRPGMLGQMVGVFGGGIVGLVVGYWLLNYFGGPQYHFVDVPLPGIPHTQPGWSDDELPLAAPQPVSDSRPAVPAELPPAAPGLAPVPHPPQQDPPPQASVSYSSEDLGQALAAAHAALGCPHCQSTGVVKRTVVTGVSEVNGRQIERKAEKRFPCDACGGKPTGRINADVYQRLCHLAQVVTFVDPARGDSQLLHRRAAVEELLLRSASDREKQAALGRLAGYRLTEPQRQGDGVLLAGTVQKISQEGDLHLVRIVLFGLPEEVTVASSRRAPLHVQQRVVIAGSILDRPREQVEGYTGNEPRLVWGGLAVELP